MVNFARCFCVMALFEVGMVGAAQTEPPVAALDQFADGEQSKSEVDLAGNWSAVNSTNASDAPPNPISADWLGIPLNASGYARALMYSPLELSEPELICGYSPSYLMLGPFSLRVWNETEPTNGTTVAWHVGGWQDMAPITIWMDGRLAPSHLAPHSKGGFASGVWVNGTLVVTLTGMHSGMVKRNGAPLSDKATITLFFIRHGDELTLVARYFDPVYLSEPYVIARNFLAFVAEPQKSAGPPCVPADEGVAQGDHPFFLPGQNPSIDEVPNSFGVPFKVVLDGAQTMYPEYRDKLKSLYSRPDNCDIQRKYNPPTINPKTGLELGPCGGPGIVRRRGPRN